MNLIETGNQYDLNGIIGNIFNQMSMSSGEEGVRGRKIGGRAATGHAVHINNR